MLYTQQNQCLSTNMETIKVIKKNNEYYRKNIIAKLLNVHLTKIDIRAVTFSLWRWNARKKIIIFESEM